MERDVLYQRVFNIAYLLTGQREAAEDVAQETVLRTLDHAKEFRGEGDHAAWARAIAINLCRARRVAERKAPKAVDPTVLESARGPGRGPISNAILLETQQRAAAALRGLPLQIREAFILHFVEDLPFKEVARLTGATEMAVRLRARRARLALRENLASFFEPEVRRRLEKAL